MKMSAIKGRQADRRGLDSPLDGHRGIGQFQLLTFAAVISFVTSPILAGINYKVMNGSNVPEKDRPGRFLKTLSWAGMVFFVLMTAGYVYVTFFYSA
ncbi:MAG: hypothetical protein AB7D06_00195 [Pedobacter sp.]